MTGGGIINRKSISILLLLLTIAFPLNVDAISAAETNQTNTVQETNQSLAANDIQNTSKTVNTSKNQVSTTKNTTTKNYAAAGTVKTVTSTSTTSLTIKNIIKAANGVKTFYNTNKRLPSYVTVSGVKLTMPQMLYYLSIAIVKIKSGSKISAKVISIKVPSVNYTETAKSGNISKSNYISEATSVYNYITKNKKVPSLISTPLGKMRYESAVLMFSKIVSFYGTNNRLPNYSSFVPLNKTTTVKNTTTSTTNTSTGTSSGYVENVVPSSLKSYLLPTANCQSDNAKIKALAASITKGLNTPLQRATAIFNWVRDNIDYSFYYNTKKGALGTLSSKTANCVDTSHLVVALERAAGFAAQYEHVTAQFSSGTWYGHVIALVYVNGVWYKADGTSYRNSFGVINNWNTKTATVHAKYRELPF
jgi:hypothetical protein